MLLKEFYFERQKFTWNYYSLMRTMTILINNGWKVTIITHPWSYKSSLLLTIFYNKPRWKGYHNQSVVSEFNAFISHNNNRTEVHFFFLIDIYISASTNNWCFTSEKNSGTFLNYICVSMCHKLKITWWYCF